MMRSAIGGGHPVLAAIAFCTLAAAPALAQEAMYTPAATMPSPGVVIVRPQLNFYQYGSNPGDGTDSTQRLEAVTSLQIGLARALSFTIEVPVEFERRRDAGQIQKIQIPLIPPRFGCVPAAFASRGISIPTWRTYAGFWRSSRPH